MELEITDGSADLERLLQEVLTVEASGWKGEAGTAIASRPETRSFYEEPPAGRPRGGCFES